MLADTYSVVKLAPIDTIPAWVCRAGQLLSITRTADELSIVCDESAVPPALLAERGWKVLKIPGPLDFSSVGVLADVSGVLADAKISIFAISTYNTDYIMVKSGSLTKALDALTAAGHTIEKHRRG